MLRNWRDSSWPKCCSVPGVMCLRRWAWVVGLAAILIAPTLTSAQRGRGTARRATNDRAPQARNQNQYTRRQARGRHSLSVRRQLRQIAENRWITRSGLRLTRKVLQNVLRQGADRNVDRPHGVYEGGRPDSIAYVERAWRRIQEARESDPNLQDTDGVTSRPGSGDDISVFEVTFDQEIAEVRGSVQNPYAVNTIRLTVAERGNTAFLLSAYPTRPNVSKAMEVREPIAQTRFTTRATNNVRSHLSKNARLRGRALRQAEEQASLGLPSDSTARSRTDRLVVHPEGMGVASYNERTLQPNWAAYQITQGDVDLSENRVRNDAAWQVDPNPALRGLRLPEGPEMEGYGRDWHRGHLVENGSRQANGQSHEARLAASGATMLLATNAMWQSAANNVGPWRHLEYHLQEQAQNGATVHVYAGPGYASEGKGLSAGEDGRIPVPDFTWKVAVIRQPGESLSDARVISVMIPNNNRDVTQTTSFAGFRTSPREVEAATGLRFFRNVPSELAADLRARVDHEDVGEVPELIERD